MTLHGKEAITGCEMPAYEDNVVNAVGNKGHPLFWTEMKAVDMFVAVFRDYNITDVWDCGAGSGAAAMAAAMCGVRYEFLAMNEKHANFLNNVMDKVIFAIIANKTADDDETKQMQSEILANFAQTVEEARTFLYAPDPAPSADCETDDGSEHSDGE